MCTLTFFATQQGYTLGMNRDESRKRVRALAPRVFHDAQTSWLAPTEPAGGAWIAANEHGAAVALLNWYSAPQQIAGRAVSRGQLVALGATSRNIDELVEIVDGWPLARTRPFRMSAFFPAVRIVVELRWNGERVERLDHDWRTNQWASSGFDEPAAQASRTEVFRKAATSSDSKTRDWLRRLHRNHEPERGPLSICMHRSDAMSVSFTEINVTRSAIDMRYGDGPPCEIGTAAFTEASLKRRP
jgi:hypothetical protein